MQSEIMPSWTIEIYGFGQIIAIPIYDGRCSYIAIAISRVHNSKEVGL